MTKLNKVYKIQVKRILEYNKTVKRSKMIQPCYFCKDDNGTVHCVDCNKEDYSRFNQI